MINAYLALQKFFSTYLSTSLVDVMGSYQHAEYCPVVSFRFVYIYTNKYPNLKQLISVINLPTSLEIGNISNISVGEGKIRAGQVDVFTIGRH